MTAIKEAWDALLAVAGVLDKVEALSVQVRELRADNGELRRQLQDTRERLIKIETIIEEARHRAGQRQLPQ